MCNNTSIVLDRVALNDPAAIQECMERYRRLIWSVAHRSTQRSNKGVGDHAETEDAVQEIFIAVWQAAQRFDPNLGSEKTFIMTIARRHLIDRCRKHYRRKDTANLEGDVESRHAAKEKDNAAQCEKASTITNVLAQIEPEQRRVLELSVVGGLTYSQVARSLGVSTSAAKSLAQRGLAQIRRQLQAA